MTTPPSPNQATRHLDLGCGGVPRNPYGRAALYGIDLRVDQESERFKAANLAVDAIPFGDNFFDSVSAYDFLEHVPRVLLRADGQGTRAPFIELMDEIWRVLRPGGMFYASTPCYPHAAAFQDPTHVNFLTVDSHHYFAQPQRLAAMYGFRGNFVARRVTLSKGGIDFEPVELGGWDRFRKVLRARRGALSHVVWEFEAVKSQA